MRFTLPTLFALSLTTLVLSGCGPSKLQIVKFEPFALQIPTSYQAVPAATIENKQILHKVLKSFKLPTEEGVFSPNIVITSSSVAPSIDYEQFRTANTTKLKQNLNGYKSKKKDVKTFDCDGKTIQGIYTSFQITETFSKQQQTYYMAQYQFVSDWQGYIISYASGNPDDQETLHDRIETLHCW